MGDKVKFSIYKHLLKKGYLSDWTNEVFTVFEIKPTYHVTYILRDSVQEAQ